MASFMLFAIFFFGCIIFFMLLALTWAIFGKLINLQIKRWLLASKGYVEVEHISATNVRNYFIMRPKDNKFDLDDGFFHYIPECITRKGDILRKMDASFNSKMPEIDPSEVEGLTDKERVEYTKRAEARWKELEGLYKVISKLKYDPENLNRKMGMPVITYYADNPDPMNFSDRKKAYGSGVIKDMYLRLLLTQRFKDFQMMILILMVTIIVVTIACFGLWRVYKVNVSNLHNCMVMLNTSNNMMIEFTNQTLQASLQNSVIPLG